MIGSFSSACQELIGRGADGQKICIQTYAVYRHMLYTGVRSETVYKAIEPADEIGLAVKGWRYAGLTGHGRRADCRTGR